MKYIFLTLISLFSTALGFAQDSISVLWIGNSYTYVNDLPSTTSNLALSLNKKITFDSKTNGGFTFQNHVNDPATYTAIKSKNWDVVVLQGQSQEPSFPYSQVNSFTLPNAMQLADSVYANNACGNVMYFMTWGRQNGDAQWDSINTFDKMNQRLYDAYLRLADSSHSAMVSGVGAVWKYVRDTYPSINLYQSDGSHPSEAGTYLAACAFYASLFRSSPVGSSYLGNLDAQTAGQLQQAAAQIILSNTATFHIHEINKPTYANFSVNAMGLSVATWNMSAQSTQYNWNFGDGSTNFQQNPSHVYSVSGSYLIELIATGACNSDTISKLVTIQELSVADEILPAIYSLPTDYGFQLYGAIENYNIQVFNLAGKRIINIANNLDQKVDLVTDERLVIVVFKSKDEIIKTLKIAR